MVQSTMPPYEDVLVSLGLDGTVVISRAVESMQAFPPRLMHEAMQKLGTIMQNRSLTSHDRNLSGRFEGLPFADEILPEAHRSYVQGYLVT